MTHIVLAIPPVIALEDVLVGPMKITETVCVPNRIGTSIDSLLVVNRLLSIKLLKGVLYVLFFIVIYHNSVKLSSNTLHIHIAEKQFRTVY